MITYTDPVKVTGARVTPAPRAGWGGQDVQGYGGKIPTRYLINYLHRWRRVYVMQYANAGSAYVIVNGEDVFLDTDTEYRLQEVAR